MNAKALIEFTHASIRHSLNSAPVVKNLTLKINAGDAWVITGALGAGKTTVLDAIRGEKSVSRDSLHYPFLEKRVWPSEVIKILRSQVTATGNAAYYSERYHSRREEDALTLRDWLSSDLPSSASGNDRVSLVARQLDLHEHLASSTMNLSNGQTKRATIAKILLADPKVLLLDEPFVGLDPKARQNLLSVLEGLISSGTIKIILALRPLDTIPTWATHMLWLKSDGTTRHAGPISADILSQFHDHLVSQSTRKTSQELKRPEKEEILVDLRKVGVAYWGTPVLRDISWTIRAGDRWHLKGSNGSGKTTLLAMILGDHPKIYSNEVYLFGRRRGVGDGRSVFEVQSHMGHSSPELHRHYPRYRTARECVASAYGETFHPPRDMTREQGARVDEIVKYFGVSKHMDTKMAELSPALQRVMLLLRALVKKPKLVILDEPFAGMDEAMITRAKQYLDEELASHQALVFVTHYEDEVPSSITETIVLEKGQRVE